MESITSNIVMNDYISDKPEMKKMVELVKLLNLSTQYIFVGEKYQNPNR